MQKGQTLLMALDLMRYQRGNSVGNSGEVLKNVVQLMNALSRKQFTYAQVSNIVSAINEEYCSRKNDNIKINGKTKAGKLEISKRRAKIVNERLGADIITPEDIKLYKKCVADEYTERTGKCAYGYKEVRKRLGYDPDTGLEI